MSRNEEFGERVAALRRQRGLSQRDLATEIERSESWVSQVERGVHQVERIGLLQSLADALGVSMQELRADAPEQSATETKPELTADLQQLRLALSGHPALGVLLSAPEEAITVDILSLRGRVELVWTLEHAGKHAELGNVLPDVLADLERATRMASEPTRPELHGQLARAYQAAAAAFARRDEPDASWVAADRSITAAERSGQPLQAIAGHFRMAHAFMRLNQMEQAEHVATLAADVLEPHMNDPLASMEELSLFGAMHLVLAVIRANDNDRAGAQRHIAKAREAAERIGGDRNDFNTEFGPTNVRLHAVAVAVDGGNAGEALDIAATVDPSGLSPERQARFWLDVARAHAQRRHVGDAVAALRRAEDLAPEGIRAHRLTRDTVAMLVQVAGRRVPRELTALAQRTAADI